MHSPSFDGTPQKLLLSIQQEICRPFTQIYQVHLSYLMKIHPRLISKIQVFFAYALPKTNGIDLAFLHDVTTSYSRGA
jgi:hypothetical protein